MPELLEGIDFYERPTPYQVLDVPPDAPANIIRDRYSAMQRDVQDANMSTEQRAKEKERIDLAYNQLRVAGARMRVDFFLIDPQLGLKQADAIAKSIPKPDPQVEGLIKIKQMRVTHVVMTSLVSEFMGDPGKVIGMHVRSIELEDPSAGVLPEVMMPQFDC